MYINFWYPIGTSDEVKADEPLRSQLFGLNFVAFRDKQGVAHVLSDTCVHRGGSLSKIVEHRPRVIGRAVVE